MSSQARTSASVMGVLTLVLDPLRKAEALQPRACLLKRRVPAQPVQLAEVGRLVDDAHLGVQTPLLGHAAEAEPVGGCDGVPAPANLSGLGLQEARDRAHRRGLARAVAADQSDDLARAHSEGDPIHRGPRAEAMRQAGDLERRG
jgi:hypothetical protein